MLCGQCFYQNNEGRCINHCSLVGDSSELDLYGSFVSDLSCFDDCTGFRPELNVLVERSERNRLLISDMKQFCKHNGIKHLCDFMDFCHVNNEFWHLELLKGGQVFKYMCKCLK